MFVVVKKKHVLMFTLVGGGEDTPYHKGERGIQAYRKGDGAGKTETDAHTRTHTNPKPAPQARAHILTHAREIKTKLQNETKNKSISKLSERVGNWMAMTRVQ